MCHLKGVQERKCLFGIALLIHCYYWQILEFLDSGSVAEEQISQERYNKYIQNVYLWSKHKQFYFPIAPS